MKRLRQAIIRLLDRAGGRHLLAAFTTAYARASASGARVYFDEISWVRQLGDFYRVDGAKFPYYRVQLQDYEEHIRNIFNIAEDAWYVDYKIRPGDVVVEVGAGIGDTTHVLATAVGETGRVLAIEAHPGTFELLKKTVELNGLTNVECVNAAVLAEPGSVAIQDDADYSTNRIDVSSNGNGQILVAGDSLDAICARHGIDSIDFIKINIEGAERVAIKGMSRLIPRIANGVVYCHDFIAEDTGEEWYRTKDIVREFLTTSGFEVSETPAVARRPWRDRLFLTRPGVGASGPEGPGGVEGESREAAGMVTPAATTESPVPASSSRSAVFPYSEYEPRFEQAEDQPGSVRDWIMLAREGYLADSLSGTAARGAAWSFVFKIGGLILGALVQIVLVRALGDGNFGRYVYVMGWMNIIAVFTRFDFDATAIRFVSVYAASGEWGLLRGFQRTAFLFTGGLAIGLGAICAGAILSSAIDQELVLPGVIACATLPLMTVIGVHSGALRGRKLIAQSEAQLVMRPLVFIGTLLFLILVVDYQLDTWHALAVAWGAAALTLFMTGTLVRRASARARAAVAEYRYKEWFGMAAELLPSSFAQLTLASTTDVVIVGTVFGPGPAGIYAIAALLLTPPATIISSVATITAPMIADLYSAGRHVELRKLMQFVGQVNVLLAVPTVLVIYAIGPLVLDWFGPNFRQGYPVVLLLGLVPILATLGGNAGLMLSMTGNHRVLSVIVGLSAVLNIALAIALLRFGMTGVAAATAIASTARNVSLTVVATRRTGISMLPF